MSKLLVIRIRGTVNVKHDVKKTLELLGLKRRYSATIVPKNEYYEGMLRLAKDYIAWGEINFETAKLLLTKRGKTVMGKFVDESTAKKEGFESLDDMVNAVVNGSFKMNQFKVIKPYFNLTPPKGGFKGSTKKPYKIGGILGENREINQLASRMV